MSSTVALEEVPCNLCGASNSRLFYEGLDARHRHTPRVRFRLVRCRRCGLVYLNPRPTQDSLRLYYPDDFAPYRDPTKDQPITATGLARLSHSLWKRIDKLKDTERIRIIKQLHNDSGSVLDIGCATGHFLWLMQSRGWTIAGVEMNETVASLATLALGQDIQTGPFNTATLPECAFDVVTMFHTLEHLPDPLWSLQRVGHLLRPGGFVLLLVPNARNAEFWLLRSLDKNPIDIPRHLYHFSPATLQQLVVRAGLVPIRVKGFSWDGAPRLTRALEACVAQWRPRSATGRVIRTAYELTAFVFGTTLAAISGLATAGPAFFLIAQKRLSS